MYTHVNTGRTSRFEKHEPFSFFNLEFLFSRPRSTSINLSHTHKRRSLPRVGSPLSAPFIGELTTPFTQLEPPLESLPRILAGLCRFCCCPTMSKIDKPPPAEAVPEIHPRRKAPHYVPPGWEDKECPVMQPELQPTGQVCTPGPIRFEKGRGGGVRYESRRVSAPPSHRRERGAMDRLAVVLTG